ncbi:MAG: TldD/PmbA family protein [Desulfobacca sp.]|nr:TldD/PmbA family protein [Desulfobacca sp.]
MEQLLKKARQASHQAEIYLLKQQSDQIHFENGRLKEIESKMQSGLSLRIIKDGCLGFAYTKNLLNPDDLVQQALDSLQGKVEAPFDFPQDPPLPVLQTYDPRLTDVTNSTLVEEGRRICESLIARVQAQVNVSIHRATHEIRLVNSRGFNQSQKSSSYFLNASILFPGSQAGLDRHLSRKGFEEFPDEQLDFLQRVFNQSLKEVRPTPGKMKVLFFPETLYALIWRIQAAANGKNIYEKTSPLLDKMESCLFDPKITLYDDPLNDTQPQARSFDDEGTPCRQLPIIDQGLLKNFYTDLFYAGKLKKSPSGQGYKSALWGGETVALKPRPTLDYLYLKPGEKSLEELIRSIDRGVLVAGVLGAHSGNILNGDFSIGLAPAIYVENGEILGRVKDAMAGGNIYETLKEVVALEDRAHPTYGGTFPALLLDQVNVAW